MSKVATGGGRRATVRTTIATNVLVGGQWAPEPTVEHTTMDTIVDRLPDLYDENQPAAEVTESVTASVQSSERHGSDTWDIIPWKVEVTSSVTLKCNPGVSLLEAQEIAHELAFNSMLWTAEHAMQGHRINIRTGLFPELFPEQNDV